MSPACTASTSSRRSANMRTMRPMRSRRPLVAFCSMEPVRNTPEYTRKKARRPTKGSVTILNTSAATGSSSAGARVTGCPFCGSAPSTGGTSSGEGKKSTTRSSRVCTPRFFSAEPQSTGCRRLLMVPARNAPSNSSSVMGSSSRYFSVR